MIVQGRAWTTNNPIRRLFHPKPGQTVHIKRTQSGDPISITITDPANPFPAISATRNGSRIDVTLNESSLHTKGQAESLTLHYEYKPELGHAPIHEVMQGRNEAINDFYSRIWFGEAMADQSGKSVETHVITRAEIAAFCRATNNTSEACVDRGQDVLEAPLDFAIVAGWRAIMGALLAAKINGDMLRLVHLSNSFKILNAAKPMSEGDVCVTRAEVVKVRVASGTNNLVVGVRGTMSRNGLDMLQLTSEFLYRAGSRDVWDPSTLFEKKEETPVELKVKKKSKNQKNL